MIRDTASSFRPSAIALRATAVLSAALAVATLAACPTRPLEVPPPKEQKQETKRYPQTLEKDIDILFMIDNSGSMEQEQKNLSKQFPKLIEALRSKKLGNKIPNVHIGVVSSDMGVGNFTSIPSCGVVGGDKGIMQNTAQKPGCKAPSGKFISYIDGKTNIPGCSGDSIECVKSAFSCIAELGTDGCGFESQLESARAALDPKLNRNPGFLRKDAFLAVVFITDEDDCSAKNKKLFDNSQGGLNDPLGPLTSFRCFEFGIQCAGNKKRTDQGPRTGCKPAGTYLYKVQEYIDFFTKLKGGDKDRVLMAAISGPTSPVRVGISSNQQPTLQASCQTSTGFAVPAIRIKALVDAFDGQFSTICTDNFGPALKQLGEKIVASLGGQCISSPLLLQSGGLACYKGISIGGGKTCQQSCLDQVDCIIEQGPRNGTKTKVNKCPKALFNPTVKNCGTSCPCWRIIPRKDCGPGQVANTTPFGLEVLRKGDPPKGTIAVARCKTSTFAWGSKALAALPQCK